MTKIKAGNFRQLGDASPLTFRRYVHCYLTTLRIRLSKKEMARTWNANHGPIGAKSEERITSATH